MTAAFILMTALPPTRGHTNLVHFALELADEVTVVVVTQPEEPYAAERVEAMRAACPRARVRNIHATLPGGPADNPDYWALWRRLLFDQGMRPGDLVVASEDYGFELARATDGVYVPYDPDRGIDPVKATAIRQDPLGRFAQIHPAFQPTVRRTITVLGAESTGKTTLSRALATAIDGHWTPEWCRPYLERLPSPEVDEQRMTTIWHAQRAQQRHATTLVDRPFLVQDTDLFATLGFWRNWRPGQAPTDLATDAHALRSHLYLLTPATIPFAPDPLRYGVTERETSDAFWVDLAEEFGLDYRVIGSTGRYERVEEAAAIAREHFLATTQLAFERRR